MKFEEHNSIKEFLKRFHCIRREFNKDNSYRIKGTDIILSTERVEYGIKNLALYIVHPRLAVTNRLLNSIAYVQPMSSLPDTALYDSEYYIVVHNNVIHHLSRKEYKTFGADDIFNLSTNAKYSTESLSYLSLLSYIMEEYKHCAIEIHYNVLLSVIQDYPHLLSTAWVLEIVDDEIYKRDI